MNQQNLLGLMALGDAFGSLGAIGGGNPGPQRALPFAIQMGQEQEKRQRAMDALRAAGINVGGSGGAMPSAATPGILPPGGQQGGMGGLPSGANPALLAAYGEINPDALLSTLVEAQLNPKKPANPWDQYQTVGGQVLEIDPTTGRPRPVYTAPKEPPTYAPDDYEKYVREEQAAGRTPLSRLDYKTAGRAPLVSIGGESENEFNKATGKQFAERYVTMTDNAIKAQGNLASLAAMEQALSNPNVYTGTGAEQIQQLRRLAVGFGASPEEINAVADGEVVQSVSRQLALMLRDPSSGAGMPGAMSDADRTFLVSMVPGLPMSAEGNKRLIEVARRVSQRQIKIAEMAEGYVARNGQLDGGFTRELAAFAASNPMFTMEDYNAAMRGMSDEELRRIAGE